VQQEGGNSSGFFACTLTVTEVCLGWTEMCAVVTKAQKYVFAALGHIWSNLPFPWLGLDSDNGAEFINERLIRYGDAEKITFTRGRIGRKNANPYVEQKNWSVVRRLVGYARYDTLCQVNQLNALYAVARLYLNHFVPVRKLVSKERQGRKVHKVFDAYKTPYQRMLDSPLVSEKAKRQLRAIHATLDVVQLKRQMDELLEALTPTKQW
jgi:hypothetical protein